ncbi:tautomerase family protein [Acidiphilium sp. PA]|uniref:tautomerase family protein n=1 Tax=Acidiphilium sp. PA TaxID=2871705 RepID=UPI002242F576|nr:tautomerase family protein [Acidiphilium sp. PA]MCW8306150.1 tautomerase family protein [Acidiphilium sp. PA]
MPLLRIDMLEGRSDAELETLLDAAHGAMLAAFGVPARDRYQIVHEHKPSRLIVQDTGLGIARSDRVVVFQVTSRPRTRAEKQAFYTGLCAALQERCGIAPSDVVIAITENADEDWSFGNGEAQFLTGAL